MRPVVYLKLISRVRRRRGPARGAVASPRAASIVPKSFRLRLRRLAKDYFRLYRSAKPVAKRLTEKQIKYAMAQCSKGRPTATIAEELNVTQRRIQQLYAEFCKTGTVHVQRASGRRRVKPTNEEVKLVLDKHQETHAGVVRTTCDLQPNCNISYRRVYRIMRENGLVTHSPAKSRRRKWIRYERKFSNAMWHTDWHVMKDGRFRGLNLITYLDDASRCVVAARIFKEATSKNAVEVLREAIARFGAPATILSDNGSCFVGVMTKSRRKMKKEGPPGSTWTPTEFEAELLDRGIELINSRPYHPQTNGKLERFHRSVEEEIGYWNTLSAYVEYYNERRLHFSLDIKNHQTPLKAFSDKKVTEAARKGNPRWMEEDVNDGAK